MDSILIRITRAPDDAVLDEAHPLLARALAAGVGGACWAATSLIDGRAVATRSAAPPRNVVCRRRHPRGSDLGIDP